MPNFSVGVVVPVYNRASSMLPTLESVAAQTRLPRRLIIVDDGSADDSADSAERWIAGRRPGFEARVIRKPNGGCASARNRGMEELDDCDWFAFLDSDDQWPADFLERAAAVLSNSDCETVAAVADRLYIDERTRDERHFDLSEFAREPILWMLRWGAAVTSCSVLRASLLREANGYSASLRSGEDAELYLRLSLRGPWLHLPGQPVRYLRRTAVGSDGEESALSRKFKDNRRGWARIYDSFLRGLTPPQLAAIGPAKRIGRFMSDRWARAAEELEMHGHFLAAAGCYANAIRWRPTKWDRWKTLAQAACKPLVSRQRRLAA